MKVNTLISMIAGLAIAGSAMAQQAVEATAIPKTNVKRWHQSTWGTGVNGRNGDQNEFIYLNDSASTAYIGTNSSYGYLCGDDIGVIPSDGGVANPTTYPININRLYFLFYMDGTQADAFDFQISFWDTYSLNGAGIDSLGGGLGGYVIPVTGATGASGLYFFDLDLTGLETAITDSGFWAKFQISAPGGTTPLPVGSGISCVWETMRDPATFDVYPGLKGRTEVGLLLDTNADGLLSSTEVFRLVGAGFHNFLGANLALGLGANTGFCPGDFDKSGGAADFFDYNAFVDELVNGTCGV